MLPAVPATQVATRHGVPADASALASFAATAFRDTFGPDNRPDDMAAYLDAAFGEARRWIGAGIGDRQIDRIMARPVALEE